MQRHAGWSRDTNIQSLFKTCFSKMRHERFKPLKGTGPKKCNRGILFQLLCYLKYIPTSKSVSMQEFSFSSRFVSLILRNLAEMLRQWRRPKSKHKDFSHLCVHHALWSQCWTTICYYRKTLLGFRTLPVQSLWWRFTWKICCDFG